MHWIHEGSVRLHQSQHHKIANIMTLPNFLPEERVVVQQHTRYDTNDGTSAGYFGGPPQKGKGKGKGAKGKGGKGGKGGGKRGPGTQGKSSSDSGCDLGYITTVFSFCIVVTPFHRFISDLFIIIPITSGGSGQNRGPRFKPIINRRDE